MTQLWQVKDTENVVTSRYSTCRNMLPAPFYHPFNKLGNLSFKNVFKKFYSTPGELYSSNVMLTFYDCLVLCSVCVSLFLFCLSVSFLAKYIYFTYINSSKYHTIRKDAAKVTEVTNSTLEEYTQMKPPHMWRRGGGGWERGGGQQYCGLPGGERLMSEEW